LAEEKPLGAVEFAGRGTLISLRGPLERDAGSLPRELPGATLRGALICPAPRDMPAAGGRGTDCGRICGDIARALCGPVGLTFEPGPFTAPIPDRVPIELRPVMPPALGGRGTERAPTALGERIEPGFADDENPPCGIRVPPMELRPPFPGFEIPRFVPICCEPVLPRPIEGVFRTPAMPLRFVAGGVM